MALVLSLPNFQKEQSVPMPGIALKEEIQLVLKKKDRMLMFGTQSVRLK